MHINKKKKERTLKFCELSPGDIFIYEDIVYLKLSRLVVPEDKKLRDLEAFNAVEIETGSMSLLNDTTIVTEPDDYEFALYY